MNYPQSYPNTNTIAAEADKINETEALVIICILIKKYKLYYNNKYAKKIAIIAKRSLGNGECFYQEEKV